MKRSIIITISVLQIVIVSILISQIYYKKNQALEDKSIYQINKKNVEFFTTNNLKHFYEPKPSHPIIGISKDYALQASYTINKDTLNDRFDYQIEKPMDTFRIIALGDSVTYGLFINTPKNWTELLEDKLNYSSVCDGKGRFEVINLGVSGYDNDYSVERYRKRGIKYNPDLVIWLQVDPTRMVEQLLPLIEKYTSKFGSSSAGLTQVSGDEYFQIYLQAKDEMIKKLGKENIVNYQKKAIENLKKYYKGPVILAALDSINNDDKKNLKLITREEQNWLYFDSFRPLMHGNGLFDKDPHPNEKGHKMIAEDFYTYLINSKINFCK